MTLCDFSRCLQLSVLLLSREMRLQHAFRVRSRRGSQCWAAGIGLLGETRHRALAQSRRVVIFRSFFYGRLFCWILEPDSHSIQRDTWDNSVSSLVHSLVVRRFMTKLMLRISADAEKHLPLLLRRRATLLFSLHYLFITVKR